MGKTFAFRFWLLLITCALMLTTVRAFATVEDEINKAEDARYDAMILGDPGALAAFLADEFMYNQPSNNIATKSSYLEQLRAGEVRIYKAERYDVTIHLYGTTATAMGFTRIDLERKGNRSTVVLRYLNVWVLRDGRWQLAARQSAFQPAAK
ncbi:MAG: hypothetical protein C5B46_09375 [Proteobacteria bacterium]|nr:MAG: hypothetical protein C5B46_09375 [Pseudomonadota bacterium]